MDSILGTSTIGAEILIAQRDRRRHLYIIGQTGTGKSNTIKNLIRQDLEQGEGLAFFDPHGDDARHILDYVPARRMRDVVYLDAGGDLDRPIAWNPLSGIPANRKATATDDLVNAFKHVWQMTLAGAPRFEHFMQMGIRTLMDLPDADLLSLPLLYLDRQFRQRAVTHLTDPVIRELFWGIEYPSYSERLLSDALSPILTRTMTFLAHPTLRHILCQGESSIDLRKMMDEGRILIVNLSKGTIGETNAFLLGSLLVTGIQQAALSRENISQGERRPFNLYIDEFQNIATPSFATALSELRKYALTATIGHQYVSQLVKEGDTSLRDAVFGNVGSFLIFRVGADDAPFLAKQLGLAPEQLTDLNNFQARAHILRDGKPGDAVLTHMAELPPPTAPRTASIISYSRNRRGRDRSKVVERIEKFLERKQSTGR